MARAVALEFGSQRTLAVVVEVSGALRRVEAVIEIPTANGESAAEHGARMAEALEAVRGNRLPTVVSIPRDELLWQTFELPPAPAEDVPQMVHLQAQRELPIADDGLGFDYLPLAGDEEHRHRVVGMGVESDVVERIEETCEGARLRLQRLVPRPLGWVALHELTQTPDATLRLHAGLESDSAVLWLSKDARLAMIRVVPLVAVSDAAVQAKALAGELHRTCLALQQEHPEGLADVIHVFARGTQAPLVDALPKWMPAQVRRWAPKWELAATPVADDPTDGVSCGWEPLAGLALALAAGQPSPLDLLHPRKPPVPPSQARTWALAGAAGVALAAWLGWQAHLNIQGPRAAAAEARAQREAMAPTLEGLQQDERKAQRVEQWLSEDGRLLARLEQLALQVRPYALDEEGFSPVQDIVVNRMDVKSDQWTLQASARSPESVLPLENRLRDAGHRVDRGVVTPGDDSVPGYPVRFTAQIEINDLPPVEEASRESADGTGEDSEQGADPS
jgi:hypothetical protein